MNAKIGHVHLKVRDLERSVAFYSRFLGLGVTEPVGRRFVFMSGTDVHHEVALQEVGKGATTPDRGQVGLYHVAFEVPDKRQLAEALRRLSESGLQVATVDHRISWAMYFQDPDGNGLELYCDTRGEADGAELWDGLDRPLTPEMLLVELGGD